MATSDTYKAVSQADGSFQFNNLIPGTYEITVTASGFKTYVQQNLALQAQIAGSVNVILSVGGTTERIEVTGSATIVDTETANTSATMESRLVADLPNASRNPLNFVFALAARRRRRTHSAASSTCSTRVRPTSE